MRQDQILRTTSHAMRAVSPPAETVVDMHAREPVAVAETRPAQELRAAPGREWLLVTLVVALTAGWLAALALVPGAWWAYGLAYGACLVVALSPRFVPRARRTKVLLTALGAAAVMPVMVIGAELLELIEPRPETGLGVTVAALLAVAAAVANVGTERPRSDGDGAARTDHDRPMGRYRLVGKLGVGGMGEVWRAQHDTLARPAALKLIRRTRLEDPKLEQEVLERFRREAEVTSRLTSPHTVELYDFGVTEDGVLYYAMELLEGMSIFNLIDNFGPLEEARCAFLLRHACHSLIEAHDHGLIHRDLKPENLFVAHLGRDADFLKVLDFGLVKELEPPRARGDDRARMRLTVAGARPGTPGFMAPEQIAGAGPIDQRADVYALGCVAYFMLTGTPVFGGRVEAQILFAHVGTEPERPSERAGRPFHPGLEALIMRCLIKDPAARPTMEEVDEALAALAFDHPWSQARARAWWREADAGGLAVQETAPG